MYTQPMTSPKPLRVIGYVRVSTNKQDIGPDVQIADLRREADAKGWELEIRREHAASAKRMDNRPVLQAALKELARKRDRAYDALAVSKLDRLTRDVADGAGLLKVARKQGWALVCLDLGVDTSEDTGAAMAQMTLTFAELERKRIGQRTAGAMQQIKQDKAKHMGRASALPERVRVRISDERQAGTSYAKIATALNEDGTPTAGKGQWYASTVKAVTDGEAEKRGRLPELLGKRDADGRKLTRAQIAAALGVSAGTLRRLIAA